MVVADLHVHTTNSDGMLTVGDLPAAAHRAGLSAVAITDHDRPHPDLSAPVTDRDGVTVVHGIELRVTAGDQRVDLLGYGLRRTDALIEECARLQRDRVERGRAIVERVEDFLDIDLGVEIEDGIGRPHIARAIADATDYSVQRAFDDLIGDGRPCYVARDVPDFERGRRLLAEACGVVGLAHPFRYDDPAAALELTGDLDAVERYYPYDHEVDPAPVDAAIEERDLLATGGSDAHGTDLGLAGLGPDDFERIRAQL